MNTFLSRLNVVFAYTLTVLAALTFGCFVTSFFFKRIEPAVEISVNKQIVRHVRDFSVSKDMNDLGYLTFDISTDVSPIFNWNVKQLFIFLTAEYETKSNQLNQVVLWDKIILRGESTVIKHHSMNTKYYFFDDGAGLKGHNNITLTLSWNVIPNAGILPRFASSKSYRFSFPSTYSTGRIK